MSFTKHLWRKNALQNIKWLHTAHLKNPKMIPKEVIYTLFMLKVHFRCKSLQVLLFFLYQIINRLLINNNIDATAKMSLYCVAEPPCLCSLSWEMQGCQLLTSAWSDICFEVGEGESFVGPQPQCRHSQGTEETRFLFWVMK